MTSKNRKQKLMKIDEKIDKYRKNSCGFNAP